MSLIQRLKTLFGATVAATLLWTAPVDAAGTLPLAMAQQVDINGAPLAGCQVYFFTAGTAASPQNAFADFSLTQALASPLSCDQSGRVPMFWLADGLIHVRLTDSSGLQVIDTTMQVLGPSSGGGGGGSTVDPTAIMATGDIKARYGTGPLSGFVRANGLTIGNGTSGATERANADTQALFVYLYNTDPNLVVSGGRTGNALNDYNASKTITVPDWRGRALAALDDMGNTAAGRLTTSYFGATATVLGASGGFESQQLSSGQLPNIALTFTGITDTVNVTSTVSVQGAAITPSGSSTVFYTSGTNFLTSTGAFTPRGNISGFGGNIPHPIVQPTMLATIYMKL